ncbi:MAG: hypothetical protein IJL67_13625 [Oscillospiraceae bacterium]|nr:hypothetical protein [Oscillospiraceae bacterium]
MNTLYFKGYGYFKTQNTNLFEAIDELKKTIQHEGLEIEFNMIELQKREYKENELFFVYDSGSYKTNKSNLREAAIELIEFLKTKKINITLEKTTLRDQNDNTIEEVEQFFE